jgi:hypothetical protein
MKRKKPRSERRRDIRQIGKERASMRRSASRAKTILERVNGIEPSYAAWEAAVLPLNYTRKVGDFTWVVRNTQLDSYSTAGRVM